MILELEEEGIFDAERKLERLKIKGDIDRIMRGRAEEADKVEVLKDFLMENNTEALDISIR